MLFIGSFVDDVMFHKMGHMTCGIGSIYVRVVLEQIVINYQRIC